MSLSISLHPGRWRAVPFILLLFPSICYPQHVTLPRGNQQSIIILLAIIRQQTNFSVLYNSPDLQRMPLVDINLPPDVPVAEALDTLLAGLRLHWNMPPGERVITISAEPGTAVYAPLTVQVTNAQNEVLADASVFIQNEGRYGNTDSAGIFRHPVKGFVTTIEVSYAGYEMKTVKVTNKADTNHVVLAASGYLDQVEVIAYGSTTRRLATASVTEVNGGEFQQRTNDNVLDALEGEVTGLFIHRYNGVPGSGYGMDIRGLHSLQQGNYPLIVVDGIPLADNGGTLSTIGSSSAQGPAGASILNSISPDMIGSVEVLKGADATALYGSRASNGVILITLKKGTSQKLRITAGMDAGVSQAVKTSPLLNTTQFLALRREAVLNDGLTADSTTLPEQYYWGPTRNSNFKKTVMGGTGHQYHGSLDLSWHEKNTYLLLSGSTLEQSTVFPGQTSDNRQSVYGQLQYQSPDKKWQIGGAALYSYEGNRLPIKDFSSYEVLASDAPPFYTATRQQQWTYDGLSYTNIPALENNVYQSNLSSVFAHLLLSYRLPWPGASLETRIGYNSIAANEASRQPLSGEDPNTFPAPTGAINSARNAYNSQLVESMVKYDYGLGPGKLGGVAGVTWQGQNAHLQAIEEEGFPTDALMLSGATAPNTTLSNEKQYYRYDAIFGRLTYTIRNRYIFSGSWRRDGSSRFAPAERYGDFWSVGAAWIIPGLPYAKLRGSYGTTGNDEIGNAGFSQVYNPTSAARGYQATTLQGVAPDSLYNPYIHWEVSKMIEAALDLALLKNRLFFAITGYYSRSNNQLVTISLASQAGRPGLLGNEPIAVVNEGLEFQLRFDALHGCKFQWSLLLNVTLPRNRLASYPGLSTSYYGTTLVHGRPIDAAKAYHFTGINAQNGVYTFQGQNSNGMVSPNDEVASPAPDQRCYGGWDNQLGYKRWQLEIDVHFVVQDGTNPLGTLYQQNPPGVEAKSQLSNGPIEWLNHWRQPGDHAKLEVVSSEPSSRANLAAIYTFVQSDANIIDASYIRLRRVMLSYQWPKKDKGLLRDCRIYIRGENLWTGSRFPVTDPETQDPRVLPILRTVWVGVRFTL